MQFYFILKKKKIAVLFVENWLKYFKKAKF